MFFEEQRMYEAPMPLHPFLCMGCWNIDSEGHHAVMQSILARPENTLILMGDNAYPKNSSEPISKEFVFGEFDKLKSKMKFVALGNHNYDDRGVLEKEFALHNEQPTWNMPHNYYSYVFQDRVAIVVLDTAPFHFWATSPPQDNLTLADAEPMLLWLEQTVKTLAKANIPYYIIQHDPFVLRKRDMVRYMRQGHTILDKLWEYPPIRILCADTHNFQEGRFMYKGTEFRQCIVGTGGGTPDDVYEIAKDKQFSVSYKMDTFHRGYGYARVSDERGPVEFIKVMDWGRKTKKTRKGGRRIPKRYTKNK